MSARHRHQRDRDRRLLTPRRIRRIEGGVLLLLSAIGVILATLRPVAPVAGELCFVCGPHATVDLLANVLLFIPIGAGLGLLGLRWRSAIAVGIVVTVLIETLQFALPIGRVASVSDLVANVAGSAIGFFIAEHRRAIAYPRSHRALRYATIASLAWLLTMVVTGVAMLPTVPDGDYIAQWRPAVPRLDRFAGTVVAARASDVPLSEGPVAEATELRAVLAKGARVEAGIRGTGRAMRLAPIVRLLGTDSTEIFMLGQRRRDLVFRSRVIGTAMHLVTPMVALPDAFTSLDQGARNTLVIGGRRERGQLRVGVRGRDAVLPLHTAAGWLLFLPPSRVLSEGGDVTSAVWVGAPLFLPAYWAGRRARRRARRAGDPMRMRGAGGQILRAFPVLLSLAAVGLAGISALLGLSQPSWTIWVGAVSGISVGLLVGGALALSRDERPHGTSRSGSVASDSADRATRSANA